MLLGRISFIFTFTIHTQDLVYWISFWLSAFGLDMVLHIGSIGLLVFVLSFHHSFYLHHGFDSFYLPLLLQCFPIFSFIYHILHLVILISSRFA